MNIYVLQSGLSTVSQQAYGKVIVDYRKGELVVKGFSRPSVFRVASV